MDDTTPKKKLGRQVIPPGQMIERMLKKEVSALWKKSGGAKGETPLSDDDVKKLQGLARLELALRKGRGKGVSDFDEEQDEETPAKENMSPEELREAMWKLTENHRIGGPTNEG